MTYLGKAWPYPLRRLIKWHYQNEDIQVQGRAKEGANKSCMFKVFLYARIVNCRNYHTEFALCADITRADRLFR